MSDTKDEGNKLFWGLLGIILTVSISWGGWVTISIMDRPTITEIKDLIDSRSPYVKDRNLIISQLQDLRDFNNALNKDNTELSIVTNNNTAALNELKAIIEKLKKE